MSIQAEAILSSTKLNGKKISGEIVGSIRRKKPITRDIDIIIYINKSTLKNSGELKSKYFGIIPFKKNTRKIHAPINSKKKVDFFLVLRSERAFALYHYTGSKQYNIRIRAYAKKLGYKMNQYGIFNRKTNKILPICKKIKTEKQLAKFLGITYRLPQDRII